MFGQVHYDIEGKPICEICGQAFNRLMSHVRQSHKITAREYKIKCGLDLRKGICSKTSAEKTRVATLKNYDKCITKNLVNKGKASRFKNGDAGRTKEQVSEQTRIRLKENLKLDNRVEAMKKNGSRLGKSGLGNKARWGI